MDYNLPGFSSAKKKPVSEQLNISDDVKAVSEEIKKEAPSIESKPIAEKDLQEFDQAIEDISLGVDNIPKPPEGMKNKQYEKELVRARKQAKATYFQEYVSKLVGFKQKYDIHKKDFDKSFVFQTSLMERLMLKKPRLIVKIITPYGTIKGFSKKVKGSKVDVMKGTYIIQLKAIVKEKGKPTIYYHEGNPFPVVFDSEKFPYLVSSESLRQMFNANIVSQIFAGLSVGKIIGMTAGVILAIGVAIFVALLGTKGMLGGGEQILMLFPLSKKWWRKNG